MVGCQCPGIWHLLCRAAAKHCNEKSGPYHNRQLMRIEVMLPWTEIGGAKHVQGYVQQPVQQRITAPS
jgi:hypothetical protein